MKKLIYLAVAILLTSFSYAHTPKQQCSILPRLTYTWTNVGSATSVKIHWKTGHTTFDTTVNLIAPSYTTSFTGYVGEDVTFTFNDGYQTNFNMKAPTCGSLPVVLESFTGKLVGDQLQFTWKLGMESNVDHYNIEYSKTGDTSFNVLASQSSLGDTQTERIYTATVTEPQSSLAFAGIGLLVSIGLVLTFVRNRNGIVLLGLLVIASFGSCTKENPPPIGNGGSTTSYFRLREVDKDGNTWVSEVIQIKKY